MQEGVFRLNFEIVVRISLIQQEQLLLSYKLFTCLKSFLNYKYNLRKYSCRTLLRMKIKMTRIPVFSFLFIHLNFIYFTLQQNVCFKYNQIINDFLPITRILNSANIYIYIFIYIYI